jgi:hypothetical protein
MSECPFKNICKIYTASCNTEGAYCGLLANRRFFGRCTICGRYTILNHENYLVVCARCKLPGTFVGDRLKQYKLLSDGS